MDRIGRYHAALVSLSDANTDLRFDMFLIGCIRKAENSHVDGNRLHDSSRSGLGFRSAFMYVYQLRQPFRVDKIHLFGGTIGMVLDISAHLPQISLRKNQSGLFYQT